MVLVKVEESGLLVIIPWLKTTIQLKKDTGELFQAGYHDIVYEAQDGAGNQATCQFTIHVTGITYKENTPSRIPKVGLYLLP